jgi:hypothetical protein
MAFQRKYAPVPLSAPLRASTPALRAKDNKKGMLMPAQPSAPTSNYPDWYTPETLANAGCQAKQALPD